MATWVFGIALLAALFGAVGAAFQERSAAAARASGIRLLGTLLRQPRWILGGLLLVAGVGCHVVALSSAPLTVVQPIGISGLLFAVLAAAVLHGRRVRREELAGVGLTMAGLVCLLQALPRENNAPPIEGSSVALVGFGSVAVIAVLLAVATAVTGPRRAFLLAAGTATAFAATAALSRTLSHGAVYEGKSVLDYRLLICVVLSVGGAIILQHSYRLGYFPLVFATITIVDPLVSFGIGVVLFGERLPDTYSGQLSVLLGGCAIVAGTVLLARFRHLPAGADSTSPPDGRTVHSIQPVSGRTAA